MSPEDSEKMGISHDELASADPRGINGTTPSSSEKRDFSLRNLMERYQRGEEAAFEELYSSLYPDLRNYLWYLASDQSHAEDLLQECFLQIHRTRHTYLPSRPVRPWAFAIARHVYLMDIRARKRRTIHERRYPANDWYLPEELEVLASRDTINLGLSELPPDRREALVLHHALGFSFSEIGALLGIRPGTAKLRAYRGLAQLRERLKEREGAHRES